MKLRDYQEIAVNEIIDRIGRGVRSILVQSPVGSGKTVIASSTIQRLVDENQEIKILFVVNREPLVSQSYETMDFFEIQAAVVHNTIRRTRQGKLMNREIENVIITIAQSHGNISDDFKADVIMFDEAHKSTSLTYQNIRDRFGDVIVIGFTATPGRADNEDGESLDEWYEDRFSVIDIKTLIDNGTLAKPEYYSRNIENDRVVDVWNEFAEKGDRRTIIFTQDTEHSVKVQEAFSARGINSVVITAGDDFGLCENQTYNQRLEYYNDFHSGKIDVLISVMALAEGFDEPSVQNVFFCRSISKENVSLYHQMLGRGLRGYKGKDHCNIVDFCNNFDKFGPIEDFDWGEYEDGVTIKVMECGEQIHDGNIGKRKLFVRCEECSHVYDSRKTPTCGICGHDNDFEIVTRVERVIETVKSRIPENIWKSLLIHSKNKTDNLENRLVAFKKLLSIANKASSMKQYEMFNRMYFNLFDGNRMNNKAISILSDMKNFNLDTKVVM